MDEVLEWIRPLVSGIAGGLCAWGLVALARQKSRREGQRRYLEYGTTLKVVSVLLIPLAAFVVYAVSQSYEGQEIAAFLVTAVFIAGAVFLPYQILFVQFSYDDEFVYYKSPLGGSRKAPWIKLADVGYSRWAQSEFIIVEGIGRIWCSNMLNGYAELGEFLETKVPMLFPEGGTHMTFDRWLGLMQAWGFERNSDTFMALVSSYREEHRHYHTIEHIDACLRHVDTCRESMKHPHEVELALWFHDAIYEPLLSDNEVKSAEWATAFLAENKAEESAVARVQSLIMATVHDMSASTGDEALLVDIDLAILGARSDVYDMFEKNVRKEYWMVPDPIFRAKRSEVLQGFLDRSCIYTNAQFRMQYERQARENLARAISTLKGARGHE